MLCLLCGKRINRNRHPALAEACGCTKANLYVYFKNLDELIIDSTAYCMSKVEDDFLTMAPTDPKDVMRFLEEVPYWTAKNMAKIPPDVPGLHLAQVH